MLEINPLVITSDNRVLALDAKVDIDRFDKLGVVILRNSVIQDG